MNRTVCAALAAMLLLLVGCGTASQPTPAAATLPCPFYHSGYVQSHLRSHSPLRDAENLYGVIVPHHAPQMQMTADALFAVEREIETVVVIAPNHEGIGGTVQVSDEGYYWQDGSIGGDRVLAQVIMEEERLGAETGGEVFLTDHAASVQMPYIRAAFPNALVVTVFLKRAVTQEQLDTLAEILLEVSEEKSVLILASIDFSHGQSPEQMAVCDAETREAVKRQDYALLRSRDAAHMDAPHVMSLMLVLAQKRGEMLTELACETDIFPENGVMKGASYFVWGLE